MILTLTVAAVIAVTGATASAGGDGDQPVVVATTSIWADIVDELDCADRFVVETLIPRGADVHSFEPSMRDRELLDGAALVVANGGGLEELLADTLDAIDPPVVAVVDAIDAGDDPHVWFDPTLVAEAMPAVAEALVDAGADEATMDDCLDAYLTELEQLDAEIAEILDAVPADRRVLVTNHDALGHFADRYDFEILGTVLPGTSSLAEASPGELDALAEQVEEAGVPAIFTEYVGNTDEATALAERLGIEVVPLYAEFLGEQESGAESYADLMRYNATAIADALGE